MLKEKTIPETVEKEMLAYLYMNNLIIKTQDLSSVTHVPVSVFPTPIPKSLFNKIEFYQVGFNKIIDKMSRDNNFLVNSLSKIGEKDTFVQRFLEISKLANSSEKKQVKLQLIKKIQLGIFRNDFMVDKVKKFIFQIELNTIASSMGTFSDKLKGFFNYFSKKYPSLYADFKPEKIPLEKDNVVDNIATSMYSAIKLFSPNNFTNTIIVFVVQEEERNEFDQRSIEVALWEKYNIRSVRLSMKEIFNKHEIDSNNNILIDQQIVSLFFFRAGYSEKDYPDELCWKAREIIETSSAIKCPNIDTFLCTFKIFQYYLKKKENLLRYIPEESIVNDISRFFTSIYFTGDINDKDELNIILEDVKKNTGKYIVKPMKEGGGNNYYNNDILKIIDTELINTSIIMERINATEQECILLENNKITKKNCVSEVSIYGIILSDDTQVHLNKQVGFLLRTKDASVQEGGVLSASAAIDLPYLVDN